MKLVQCDKNGHFHAHGHCYVKKIQARHVQNLELTTRRMRLEKTKWGSTKNTGWIYSYCEEKGLWIPNERNWLLEWGKVTTISSLHELHACCSSLPHSSPKHNRLESAIADSGTTKHFVSRQAPRSHCQRSPHSVKVKVANGQHAMSNLMTHVNFKKPTKGHHFILHHVGVPRLSFYY